jgi:hypothetical protein
MKILNDEHGQAVIFVSFIVGILFLGLAALAIDVGMLYRQRRFVQTAADSAALAAAAGKANAVADITSVTNAASLNGITVVSATPATWQATANIVDPIATVGTRTYLQVSLTQQVPTIFMGAILHTTSFKVMPVTAMAEASYIASNNACMTALSPTGTAVPYASGVETDGSTTMQWGVTVMADIATEGSSHINTPGCGIAACGPAVNPGSGQVAASIYAWGGGTINALSNEAPSYGTDNTPASTITATPILAADCSNPLAGQMPAAPSTSGACIDPAWMSGHTAGGAAKTISPGTYCNFNTENVSTLTMNPGLYVIKNTFSTNSGSVINGNGVTIYLANGAIANSGNYTYVAGGATPYGVANGTTMNITAPTSGTYANIAIWDGNSSASTPDTVTFGGGAASTFSGNIYAPNSNLVLGNGTGTSTLSSNIIANTIMVIGGSTISNSYTPPAGPAVAGSVNIVE